MTNMVLIDANAIIRIIINDNKEMARKVTGFISENQVLARNEVLAEIVYVLQKVYKIDKIRICNFLFDLIENDIIKVENKDIIKFALDIFGNRSLDFVDCLLYSYHSVNGNEVFTFDKTLRKLVSG